MADWFVLWVLTGNEDRIARRIRGLPGVDLPLVPRGPKWIRKDGQWQETEAIYFPGYIFLRGAMRSDVYYALRGLPGVIGWLGTDSTWPTRVPENEMQAVLALHRGAVEELPLTYDRRQRRASGEIPLLGKPHRISVGWWPQDKQPEAVGVDASPDDTDGDHNQKEVDG